MTRIIEEKRRKRREEKKKKKKIGNVEELKGREEKFIPLQ